MIELRKYDDNSYYKAGEFESSDIIVRLFPQNIIDDIDTSDLPSEVKKKIREQREHFNNSLDSVLKDTFEYEISLHQYYDLLYIKQNAYKNRPISNKTFARYLLQSLNVKELNQICRDHKLKGYSALKKQFLIDFIIDNLTEDELKYFLVFNEDRVIEKEIKQAIKVLKHKDTEKFQEAKIINQDNHDIELHFTNLNFDMVS